MAHHVVIDLSINLSFFLFYWFLISHHASSTQNTVKNWIDKYFFVD